MPDGRRITTSRQVHPGFVQRVQRLAPDGRTVFWIGWEDGRTITRSLTPEAWAAHACRLADRTLTDAEWAELNVSWRPKHLC